MLNFKIVNPGIEIAVNPVPRTYVRGFGALPSREVQYIHPRAHARGVLWYGVNKIYKYLTRLPMLSNQIHPNCRQALGPEFVTI